MCVIPQFSVNWTFSVHVGTWCHNRLYVPSTYIRQYYIITMCYQLHLLAHCTVCARDGLFHFSLLEKFSRSFATLKPVSWLCTEQASCMSARNGWLTKTTLTSSCIKSWKDNRRYSSCIPLQKTLLVHTVVTVVVCHCGHTHVMIAYTCILHSTWCGW